MLTGKNTGLRRTSVVSLLGGILELQFLCGPGLERGLTGNREGCKLTTETNVSDGERSKELNSSRHFFSKAYPSSHPAAPGVAVAAALYIIYVGAKDGTQDFTSMRQAFCP